MKTTLLVVGIALLLAAQASAQAVIPPFDTGLLYWTEADFMRAIQPYQQAIAVNPRNVRAQYWLGFAYYWGYVQYAAGAAPYASGYLTKAEGPLLEAIRLDPTNLDAYTILVDVYHLMGNMAKANETTMLMLERTRPGWLPKLQGVQSPNLK